MAKKTKPVKKKATPKIKKRLEELRVILRSESMSYGELAELQDLSDYVADGDVELLEASGVSEEDANRDGRM